MIGSHISDYWPDDADLNFIELIRQLQVERVAVERVYELNRRENGTQAHKGILGPFEPGGIYPLFCPGTIINPDIQGKRDQFCSCVTSDKLQEWHRDLMQTHYNLNKALQMLHTIQRECRNTGNFSITPRRLYIDMI